MKTTKFTYWQDGDYFLGFLNDYPDYQMPRHNEIHEGLAKSIIRKLSKE